MPNIFHAPLFMRLVQTIDFVANKGLAAFFKETFYYNRVAVVVEKSLLDLSPVKSPKQGDAVDFVEITYDFLNKGKSRNFPVKNRYLKCWNYLKKGYNGYAIMSDQQVIGDIWYNSIADSGNAHPDCRRLGIFCDKSQVYAFDMFLNPDQRRKNLAVFLQNRALMAIKEKGFKKAFGFFWADNIPALWAHRMQKWKEIRRVKSSRFLLFKTSSPDNAQVDKGRAAE
jgi:GNAT superfamily N-acetyltransferase